MVAEVEWTTEIEATRLTILFRATVLLVEIAELIEAENSLAPELTSKSGSPVVNAELIEATNGLKANRSIVAEVPVVKLITPTKLLKPLNTGCELLMEEAIEATNGLVTRISIFTEEDTPTEIDAGIGRAIERTFDTVVVVTAEIEAVNDLKLTKSMVDEVEWTAAIDAVK